MGVHLAQLLQAQQQLDRLLHYATLQIDAPKLLAALHQLYKLTFTALGRGAVVRLLSYGDNMKAVLPFLELSGARGPFRSCAETQLARALLSGETEVDAKVRKSASASYASELLLMTLRCSDSVPFLRTFADRLLAISAQEASSKTVEVRQWVEVLRRLPSFAIDSVEYLCDKVKSCIEEGLSPRLPKALITALRILHSLVVAPDADEGTGQLSAVAE